MAALARGSGILGLIIASVLCLAGCDNRASYVDIPPASEAFRYSGYCSIAPGQDSVRFPRPDLSPYGMGERFCNPSLRIHMRTDSEIVRVRLEPNGLFQRPYVNLFGAIGVDGTVSPFRMDGESIELRFDTAVARRIELIMPYGISLDFKGATILAGRSMLPDGADPRPRYVAYGDSITQGYRATGILDTWAERLASAKGYELINLGYAGKRCDSGDAAAVVALRPNLVTILIGTNDFLAQTDIAEFTARYRQLIEGVCAGCPGAAILVITPLWTSETGNMGDYRAAETAVAGSFSPGVVLVDGIGLAGSGADSFPDGIHPSDRAQARMADGLQALLP